jgi:sugar/nucleoside kinase (ribokinase family)
MKYDLICIGMALVDSIIRGFNPEPVSASGYVAESGSLNAGGEAVNEAIAAAKLGLKTGILCALGNDPAGEIVLDELRKNGVDTELIVRTDATPVTTMFVRADGSRKSITNQAHRFNFHPEKDPALFTDARAVMLGSLFRAPFDDPAIIHTVVSAAKQAGELVIADTKLPNFRFLTLEDIRESLPQIDYITPNEDEARYFTGKEEPEDMADVFLGCGVKGVIIKLGGRGCLLKNRDTVMRLPACPVRAVDATGAGDNFAAGFVSEILRGAGEKEALEFANACGAICTTAAGAGTALKSREQVLGFMRENGKNIPAEEKSPS